MSDTESVSKLISNTAYLRRDRLIITIYDIQGRLINELKDGYKTPGLYTASWNGVDRNGNNVVSGIYFVKLAIGAGYTTDKLVLLK